MDEAFQGAAHAAKQAGHLMHSSVAGGAGAYLSSLKRIGWQAPSISSIITEKGCSLMLGANCDPKMLLRLASVALERRLALDSGMPEQLSSIHVADGYHRASSQASGFVPMGKLLGLEQRAVAEWWNQFQHDQGRLIPWLRLAIDALRTAKRKGIDDNVRASFVSLIEGGWWPQSKLHHNQLAADPMCKSCGKEHGTLWHRAARVCESSQGPTSAIVDAGTVRWWDPLFARCIPALPLDPRPPSERVWCFPENAADALITGDVFIDGAMTGLLAETRRGGWAFAKLGLEKDCVLDIFVTVFVMNPGSPL